MRVTMPDGMRSIRVAVVSILLCLVAPRFAHGEASDDQLRAARAMANAGIELFEKKQWEEAYQRFKAAELVYHAPPHLLFMARCARELGRLVEARDLYRKITEETLASDAPKPFQRVQEDARRELAEVEPMVPSLEIVLHGPPIEAARIKIGDTDVTAQARGGAFDFDPGEHRIRVSAPGYDAAEATVSLEATNGVRPVEIEMREISTELVSPTAESGGPSLVVPAVILIGLGAGGLVAGMATGIVALDRSAALDEACPVREHCPESNQSLYDDAQTLGTASTVAFVVGGTLAAAGGVLLVVHFTGASDGDDADVEAFARPGMLGLRGSF
jgi:hypothetical protein